MDTWHGTVPACTKYMCTHEVASVSHLHSSKRTSRDLQEQIPSGVLRQLKHIDHKQHLISFPINKIIAIMNRQRKCLVIAAAGLFATRLLITNVARYTATRTPPRPVPDSAARRTKRAATTPATPEFCSALLMPNAAAMVTMTMGARMASHRRMRKDPSRNTRRKEKGRISY